MRTRIWMPALVLFVVLLWGAGGSAQANDNSQALPEIGSWLNIHGSSYQWASAWDDGVFRYDTYSGASTLGVTTMLGAPNLATVDGGLTGAGHIYFGEHGDNHQVGSDHEERTIMGHSFGTRNYDIYYQPDLPSGLLWESGTESYSGVGREYVRQWNSAGDWRWTLNFDLTEPAFLHTELEEMALLGVQYAFSQTSTRITEYGYTDSANTANSWSSKFGSWSDTYVSGDDATLYVTHFFDDTTLWYEVSVGGWDPYLGTFQGSYSGIWAGLEPVVWAARSSASFLTQLYVNGELVNWQGGVMDSSGVVVDTLTNSAGDLTVVLTGSPRRMMLNAENPVVKINGVEVGGYVVATGTFAMTVGGWDVRIEAPNRTAPFFSGVTLWVDGTPYGFAYGYEDQASARADVYLTSSGTLTIFGNTNEAQAEVMLNHDGAAFFGQMSVETGGNFNVAGVEIRTIAPDALPAGFRVGAQLYRRSGATDRYDLSPVDASHPSWFVLEGADMTALSISGANQAGSFEGTYNQTTGEVTVVTLAGSIQPVARVDEYGKLLASGTVAEGLPPAVRVFADAYDTTGSILSFLGTTTDDKASGSTAAYYGSSRRGAQGAVGDFRLLKIRGGGDGRLVVNLTNYTTGVTRAGAYDPSSRLFHATHGVATAMSLTQGVDPQLSDALWLCPRPESALPCFIVRGQPWWFAGQVGEVLTYRGFYEGQEMTLFAPDLATQARKVSLVDLVHYGNDTPVEGMLSSLRRSTRLRDNTLVLPGNIEGLQQPVAAPSSENLHTIAGDLDVLGSNLSFGILQGDASLAGALFQFSDAGGVATLRSTLSRADAQWTWSRAGEGATGTPATVMMLDTSNKLLLFNRSGSTAGIELNPFPQGGSTIRGVLRVRPGGDLSMGDFTVSPGRPAP